MKREREGLFKRFFATLHKTNGMIRIRKWLGLDVPEEMFNRLRNRLTISYSGMMMLFLVSFIIVVSVLLFSIISREQATEIQGLAMQELTAYQHYLQHPHDPDALNINQELRGNRFFYYITSNSGKLEQADETMPELRPTILKNLKGWTPTTTDVRYLYVSLRNDRDLLVVMAGRQIIDEDGRVVGVMYTGKDASGYLHMFLRLFEILGSLLVLYFVIAAVASHFMAKRAMVPITNSFMRQREFVADASHELRTPLTILQSSVEVIQLEDDEHLSEFSRKVLLDMKDEVGRMSRLVNDLLMLARSDSGSLQLIEETFDVVAMAEQLVRSFQYLTIPREIDLKLVAPEDLLLYGDQERLKQLLYILVDNAIKYSLNQGAVVIELQAERVDQKDWVILQVQDKGIGIDLEQQERIFDRFYRSDKIRSREMGGVGLGLSIAKWIVEAHHGTIQVKSKPGEGSMFTVHLPQLIQ